MLPLMTMAERRPDGDSASRAKKRQKTETADMDPRQNKYLAHWYEDETPSNGYSAESSILDGFKRHKTTAAMAKEAEDSALNPFNGKPFSSKYFSILKTRRDLPVHTQRYVFALPHSRLSGNLMITSVVEMSSYDFTRNPKS